MKARTVIFLLIAASLLVLPTIWQSDRVDSLEEQAAQSESRADDARAQRDALETTVSTLADDVTALRAQAQQSGLEPVAPPAEDRISENPVPSSADSDVTSPAGPTLAQLEQVVQACFAQGFCTAPAGAEGREGQAGQAGEDADELTAEQIMQGVADCVDAGLCTLPEGPPGPAGQQGEPGPPGQTCPEGYTFTQVRAPFQVNDWFVCVANDGGK